MAKGISTPLQAYLKDLGIPDAEIAALPDHKSAAALAKERIAQNREKAFEREAELKAQAKALRRTRSPELDLER